MRQMSLYPILRLIAGLSLLACDDRGGPEPGGPSTDGTLVVSTATGGDDPDPDGYLLAVDGVDSLVLAVTGTAYIGLPAGHHTLLLLGVAEQCSVAPATSFEVDVPPQSTTSAAFEISCALTGARITTTTTGLDFDPDGYRVEADGAVLTILPSNGTVLTRLHPGSRTMVLTGLAPNCTVSGPGSQTVTIVAAEVVPIEFAVVCTATTHGSRTLAFESDGDIYRADIDGSNLRRLTFDGSTYSYNYGAAWSPDGSRIAFSKSDGQQGAAIYVVDANGTNLTRLSPQGPFDAEPSWSPDGSQIAFAGRRDSTSSDHIFVMNADGTHRVQLTTNRQPNFSPAWSPDGNRIAYVTYADSAGDSGTDIYVMNADGTNRERLTSDEEFDWTPAWSPDGSRIVFSRSDDLFVVDADGTNPVRLTPAGVHGGQPAWSPDGGLIAFTTATNCHVDSYGETHCDSVIRVFRIGDGSVSVFEVPLGLRRARGPSWQP